MPQNVSEHSTTNLSCFISTTKCLQFLSTNAMYLPRDARYHAVAGRHKTAGTTSTTALQDAHTRLVLEIYVGSNAILGKSSLLLNRSGLTHKTWVCCKALKYVCYIQYVGQRVTKLTVLLQPYLLQVVYMTFQRLTVSCILA